MSLNSWTSDFKLVPNAMGVRVVFSEVLSDLPGAAADDVGQVHLSVDQASKLRDELARFLQQNDVTPSS